jgi:hypothetical protein
MHLYRIYLIYLFLSGLSDMTVNGPQAVEPSVMVPQLRVPILFYPAIFLSYHLTLTGIYLSSLI